MNGCCIDNACLCVTDTTLTMSCVVALGTNLAAMTLFYVTDTTLTMCSWLWSLAVLGMKIQLVAVVLAVVPLLVV